MIEGLKIEVTSAELVEHLTRRRDYHHGRVEFYLGQVKALKQGDVQETGHSNDPVGSLQASARQHAHKRDFFEFMSEHVVLNEIYRLTQADLGLLEFIASLY